MIMSRKILIIVGGLILTLLFFAWVYLLIFSSPQEAANWFEGNVIGSTPISQNRLSDTVEIALPPQTLVPLTTRSVAGFGLVSANVPAASSTTTKILYAETGTGHVYEIDLVAGTETRASSITVGKTVGAVFDPQGQAFILIAERDNTTEARVYRFEAGPDEMTVLPPNSSYFDITDNHVRYIVPDAEGITAYALDLESEKTTTLWKAPLRQVQVWWLGDDALIINTMAPNLKSGVYKVSRGNLTRILAPQLGLIALLSKDQNTLWYSEYDQSLPGQTHWKYDLKTGTKTPTDLPAISEKCFLNREKKGTCAVSASLLSNYHQELNRWYRGEIPSDDRLWVEAENSAVYQDNLSKQAGRLIDVTDITLADDEQSFFFINKSGQTLWWYRYNNQLTTSAEEELLSDGEEVADGEVERD